MTPKHNHYHLATSCPNCNATHDAWQPVMHGPDALGVCAERLRKRSADWLRCHPCKPAGTTASTPTAIRWELFR